jgi:hypothetical protein
MYNGAYQHMRTYEGSYVTAIKYLYSDGKYGSLKGGVENYLLGIGVAQKDIDDLRAIMLK